MAVLEQIGTLLLVTLLCVDFVTTKPGENVNTDDDGVAPGGVFIKPTQVEGNQGEQQKAFNDLSKKLKNQLGLRVDNRFRRFNLLYVEASDEQVAQVRDLVEVDYIEADLTVSIATCKTQSVSGTWGLDRIDQAGPVTSARSGQYVYDSDDDGTGVFAYIVDTGIDTKHPDFGGRASWGFSGRGTGKRRADGNGHGTHCAGTVGSNTYGVAKNVQLVAVKVLSDKGSGYTSVILDGLNWIATQHSRRGTNARSVVNMSLGGGANSAMDAGVQALVDAGVVVVVAAGNSGIDACQQSPARAPNAITVGAINSDDQQYWNYGSCVDIFAPGVYIKSTWPRRKARTISGTSMAAPHVAGAVARYMSSLDRSTPASVSNVTTWLLDSATDGALPGTGNFASTENKLVYVGCS